MWFLSCGCWWLFIIWWTLLASIPVLATNTVVTTWLWKFIFSTQWYTYDFKDSKHIFRNTSYSESMNYNLQLLFSLSHHQIYYSVMRKKHIFLHERMIDSLVSVCFNDGTRVPFCIMIMFHSSTMVVSKRKHVSILQQVMIHWSSWCIFILYYINIFIFVHILLLPSACTKINLIICIIIWAFPQYTLLISTSIKWWKYIRILHT